MRTAISTDNGSVSAHFGRCPVFTIVEVEDGKVKSREEVPNPVHEPGYLPEFLRSKGVGRIVAGGMGQRAVMLFNAAGIEITVGVAGPVDAVIEKLAGGTLEGPERSHRPPP